MRSLRLRPFRAQPQATRKKRSIHVDLPAPLLAMIRPNSPCCASVAASPPALVHQIEPATVPTRGLQLERRYVLARGTDGQPVL